MVNRNNATIIFTKNLIIWYLKNKRDLPWRHTLDPYKIWLSEVILQQTRVAQGLPYYQKFVKHYPVIEALANESEEKVLRLWQGLGYYSRAKNLHRCAKHICEKWQGTFPTTYTDLLKLPGVGRYTAAAIASFCYKEPVAVVDGNVNRVIARAFGVTDNITKSEGVEKINILANKLIDVSVPDTYNQAIMEFGALQCIPKNPDCNTCFFNSHCYAFKNDVQHQLPIKSKKGKVKERHFYYYILKYDNHIFMNQRKEKDIWQGLYDFFLIEADTKTNPLQLLKTTNEKILKNSTIQKPTKKYTHILSHQKINARFIEVDYTDMPKSISNGRFYSYNEIRQLPKSILIDKYLNENIF